ncbi:DUF1653 domain-containing protein [Curtobacterium sp. NPDC088465]|uniref:DUF1653 domain-containing protein n=1 Tax=Curtobacterium sp. NPDC088465 TaxID=3363967 RepID=UPI003811A6B8
MVLVAKDVDTEEPIVVYAALNGERRRWVRSLADFTAHVTRDGNAGPRFLRRANEQPLGSFKRRTKGNLWMSTGWGRCSVRSLGRF